MATTSLLAFWSALALAGTQANPVALAATQAPSGGTLEGRVLAAQTQAPIAHAVVTLGGDPSIAGVLTDAAGFYRLEDVPAGRVRLEASRPGFAALEVELVVPEGGRLAVDFLLPMEPVSLPPLLARSGPGTGDATLAGTGERSPRAGRVRIFEAASPGVSEVGLLATARALRGADARDAGERLFVRTAGAQLDLVLLNGAPVHAPYHLGGLLEPLPPGVIESVAVHRGGAPARYDGGLSDLVRIESRTGVPGQVRSSGHLDMASAGAFVEGGTSDVSILASARAIHGAGSRLVRADRLPQGYADVLVRADVAPGEETSLAASFFWNRESVDLALPGADQGEARWGNTAGSLQFRDSIGAAGVEVTAGLGEFRTTLPIGGERGLVAEGLSRRARLAANAGIRVEGLRLDAGFNFSHVVLLNDFMALFPTGAGQARLRFESDGGSAASYVDAAWRLSEDVAVGAGLRATAFSFDGGLLLAPRARLAWRASPDLTLSISAGRHHQIVPSPDSTIDLGTTFLTSSTGTDVGSSFTRLAVARASHFVVGMDHAGPSGLEFGLDGYWQTFREVPGARRTPVHQAGVDVSVRHGHEDLRIWATYTMAWAWTENGARVPAEVSGRHFLRAGAAAEVIDRLDLEGDLSFGDGLSFGAIPRTPVSSPPGPTGTAESDGARGVAARGPPNPPMFDPDPNRSYLRLNLQASAPWTAELFGHSTELRPYVRVVNVLARHDALFYHFDPGVERAPRPVGTLPLVPVIGLEWRM